MAETPGTIQVNVVPTSPPPSPISPKVIASTIATLAVSLLVAILTQVANDPAALARILDAVPDWARFIIVACLPTLVTFLAGYVKRDPTREVGTVVQDRLNEPGDPDVAQHEPAAPELEALAIDPDRHVPEIPSEWEIPTVEAVPVTHDHGSVGHLLPDQDPAPDYADETGDPHGNQDPTTSGG